MILKAKVCLLEYSNPQSQKEIDGFFKASLPLRLLHSRGFSSHISFVEIPISFDSITNYKFNYNYKFIFAFNSKSKTIYRLKGFNCNDFYIFFNDAYFANNINYLVADTQDISSLKKFMRAFYIEGLDMKCLYRSLKKEKQRPACLKAATKILN